MLYLNFPLLKNFKIVDDNMTVRFVGQGFPGLQFAVMFGGVFFGKKFESNPIAKDLIADWKAGPLQTPSVHIIGERDYVRQVTWAPLS